MSRSRTGPALDGFDRDFALVDTGDPEDSIANPSGAWRVFADGIGSGNVGIPEG